MQETSKTNIGYVVDVQGDMLTATILEDEQGRLPTVTVGDEDITVGRIGSYVLIRQNVSQVVAVVTRMTEHESLASPSVETPGEDSARLPFAKRLARLTPIGSLDSEGNFERGVGQYPTTGAEVHALSSNHMREMFAGFHAEGVEIGALTANPAIRVSLHASNLFGRHVAILGQTGAGKSWAVASVLQHAVREMPEAHIIVLDVHGEYCWRRDDGTRHYAFDDSVVRHIDARDLEIPYWLMTYSELCDLMIDRTEQSAHNQTAFFRDVLRELREQEREPLGLDRVTVDTPVYFSLAELVNRIRDKNTEMVRGSQGKQKQGEMYGTFDRFLIRLESRMNDKRYDFLLNPSVRTTSASLSDLLRDFVGLSETKAPITVIDLSADPFDVRPTVTAQIGRLAFEFNYWNPRYREFPIALMCEEAHGYVPRTETAQFAGSRKSMERIAKEGRKYGVGLGVISQRPHELSETVLAQCGTFMCLRLTNPDDQSYVRSLVPETEGDLVSVLAGLGRGEALVLGEAVPIPARVQCDKPVPAPYSDDVNFYHEWRRRKDDLDVDDIVDRWRRQER